LAEAEHSENGGALPVDLADILPDMHRDAPRHPEVAAKQPSKDAADALGAVAPPKSGLPDFALLMVKSATADLIGSLRSHLRVTVNRKRQGPASGRPLE
jgi:hypothetical protein